MRAKFSSLTCDCVKIDLNNKAPCKELDEIKNELNRLLGCLQNILSEANQLEKIIKDAEQATLYEIRAIEAEKSDLTSARNSTPRAETVTEVSKRDVYGNVEKRTTSRPINTELVASYNKQIEQCDQNIKAKYAYLQTLKNAGDECFRVVSELGGYVNEVESWQRRLSDCENELAEECGTVLIKVKDAEDYMRRYASVYPEVIPYKRIPYINEN